MPSTVLVGAQWGDEGKGKICDLVAGDFDAAIAWSVPYYVPFSSGQQEQS